MVRETVVSPADLVMPLFIHAGKDRTAPIKAMPGISRITADLAVRECVELYRLGIPAVLLFGIPDSKDAKGSGAWDKNGVVQNAVRAIKKEVPAMVVITDVCLCEYTSHGHCGVVHKEKVLNDPTLDLLARMAVSHAQAGADIVAPSDMMDGRVGFLRKKLDTAGFIDTSILAYSAKYASAFYGPFRDAADSAPSFGDRASYQMDPANAREAMREVRLDIEEGADMVMVKPALAYLDIIRRIRDSFDVPLAAYNVSGEYSMVKAAGAQKLLDEKRTTLEVLTAIKRAGADIIITYHAREAASWLTRKG